LGFDATIRICPSVAPGGPRVRNFSGDYNAVTAQLRAGYSAVAANDPARASRHAAIQSIAGG
jgi:hypothetical protein